MNHPYVNCSECFYLRTEHCSVPTGNFLCISVVFLNLFNPFFIIEFTFGIGIHTFQYLIEPELKR